MVIVEGGRGRGEESVGVESLEARWCRNVMLEVGWVETTKR